MRKLLLLLLLILAAYLLWRWWNRDRDEAAAADRGQKLFFDRLWVDHMPKSDTDEIDLFVAVTEQPIGLFQKTSNWRGSFELFRHADKGDGKLVVEYPQTKDKERISYRAWRCKEGRFTFCLDVQGASRGVKRYYSEEGWEVGQVSSAAALEHAIETRLPALAAH